MAKVIVETPDGVKAEFLHFKGINCSYDWLPYLPYGQDYGRHLDEVRDMNIRDEDLYLTTYPKCGTHWVWEFMTMLKRGSAEHEKCNKETVFLDFEPVVSMDTRPSPRILNGHLPIDLVPREIFQKKVKIVNVMRNPKDAYVSMYHHFKAETSHTAYKDFKTFLSFALGKYGLNLPTPFFTYIKEWQHFTGSYPDQIINIFYEDIKEDPVREITKLDKFLGTNRDAKLIEQIAEACDFKNLKKADAEVKVKEGMLQEQTGVLYRKGEVGDWKNHFTVNMNEEMDQWIEQNSRGCNIKFRYTI